MGEGPCGANLVASAGPLLPPALAQPQSQFLSLPLPPYPPPPAGLPPYFVVPPAPPHQSQWGFGSIRSWLSACRRRVGVLMTSFPHVVAVRKRFEAKEQTTLMNNADDGLLWVRRSCGRKRSLGDIRRQPAVLGKVVCV